MGCSGPDINPLTGTGGFVDTEYDINRLPRFASWKRRGCAPFQRIEDSAKLSPVRAAERLIDRPTLHQLEIFRRQ